MEVHPLLRALLLRDRIYGSMSQEERIVLAIDRLNGEESEWRSAESLATERVTIIRPHREVWNVAEVLR
jgi:hypothetical protein